MAQPRLPDEPVIEEFDNDDLDGFIAQNDTASDEAAAASIAEYDADEDAGGETPAEGGGVDPGEAPATETEEAEATPAEPDSPAAVTPPALDPETIRLMEDNRRLTEENNARIRQQQEAERDRAIATEQARYETELVELQGWDPQHAKQQAAAQAELYKQRLEIDQTKQTQSDNLRTSYAIRYSQQYGVPVDELDGFDSAAKMEQFAATRGQELKEMALLKKQVQLLTKAGVPPQDLDRPAASRSGGRNEDQLLDAYNSGDRSAPAVEAARRAALGA